MSRYCSKACQVNDRANHKQFFLAINDFSENFEKVEPGRGDGEDDSSEPNLVLEQIISGL